MKNVFWLLIPACAASIAAAPRNVPAKKIPSAPRMPAIEAPRVPEPKVNYVPDPDFEDEASRAINRFGIGIYLGGPDGLGGGYLAYYIFPFLDAEAGGMRINAFNFSLYFIHAGFKWHVLGSNTGQRWSPYVGAMVQYVGAKTELSVTTGNKGTVIQAEAKAIGIYVPVGIELVAYNGFNFAIEAAYNYIPKITAQANDSNGNTVQSELKALGGIWGGIKLGYRFWF